ncbi:CNNM domain-containing protein [Halegenticoccus tardaugens]|uniref:CNNM domain-containing protein n=1 Tax=Halegenticoccus tardaugens TaxID=2071624 RepID=UPI00100BFF50|nr:hemolysin family protein [Halegenticoccus tardaugens]
MDTLVAGGRIVAGLLLILANAFFVATEFALTRVRQYPESEFDEPGLRRPWEMTERLEIYLTSCQVGITASSIAVGIVAEPALVAVLEPLLGAARIDALAPGSTHVVAVALSFFIINLLHLTHGEQTPTYLGVERTKLIARYGARPLYWFTMFIYPLIYLGDKVAKWTLRLFGVEISRSWVEAETDAIESRADLRNEIGEVLDRGDLSEERREEVLNALKVGERPVGEIAISPDNVATLSTERSFEENLSVLEEHPHTRFPLVGDSLTDFRGIVYVPTITRHLDEIRDGEVAFEDLAADPLTAEADATISELIDRFQEERQELALVRDGEEAVGIVTATDAFESVMGELEDPTDVGRVADPASD